MEVQLQQGAMRGLLRMTRAASETSMKAVVYKATNAEHAPSYV